MAQNIYDDPEFFDGYARLSRSVQGLDGAPEWPTLRAMLPPIAGADVVDLGCGYGWFCRWAAARGARSVTGYDISERMLARANADGEHRDAITYRRADLDLVELPEAGCDVVFSSLALHYVVDLERLVAQVAEALRPGGTFVFSAEHPIRTAPTEPHFDTDAEGRRSWALGSYAIEGPRRLDWITEGVIKQHRKISTYLSTLMRAGLELVAVDEWAPSEAEVAQHPDWGDELHRPSFLLVAATRRGRESSGTVRRRAVPHEE